MEPEKENRELPEKETKDKQAFAKHNWLVEIMTDKKLLRQIRKSGKEAVFIQERHLIRKTPQGDRQYRSFSLTFEGALVEHIQTESEDGQIRKNEPRKWKLGQIPEDISVPEALKMYIAEENQMIVRESPTTYSKKRLARRLLAARMKDPTLFAPLETLKKTLRENLEELDGKKQPTS